VILVQDLPTEAAHAVGMIQDGLALRAGRKLEHLAYTLADHIVVISSSFASYIEGLGVNRAKISEIPNWADVDSIRPTVRDRNMRFRLGAGPDDFLVVHSGNMGAKQDLLNVVAAAAILSGKDKRIKIALVGDGQERANIAEGIASRQLDNITLLPLVAPDEFSTLLGAANVLLVNQAPMVVDSVLPSKLLAYMAAGRPLIVAAHSSSSTASLVRDSRCGVLVDPGQPKALAERIRVMASELDMHERLDSMGLRGRMYVEMHFKRSSILSRWDGLIANLE
jgi:colanic acid biosynthesis glycosyl transferase WcaI